MNHKLILSLLLFLITGCSQQINIISLHNTAQPISYICSFNIQAKSLVVLANSGSAHNAIIVSNNRGKLKLDKVRTYVPMNDKNKKMPSPKMMSKREFQVRFASPLNALPSKPLSYKLYFKEDHMELTKFSKELLPFIIKKIIEKSPCVVDIIGHTDTTGDENENFDISFQEANNVKSIFQEKILKYLTCQKDITLITKGYGEKDLFIPTPDNQKEIRNRYVEIYIK